MLKILKRLVTSLIVLCRTKSNFIYNTNLFNGYIFKSAIGIVMSGIKTDLQ